MNKLVKIHPIKVIFVLTYLLPVNGQQVLNETYLHAKADMIREEFSQAGEKILSIPEGERTADMYLTLGKSFYYSGNFEEAANYFEFSEKIRSNPETQLYAARTHAMIQQSGNAVEWLLKYLSQRDKLSESELTLDPAFSKIERSREWRNMWESREWYTVADRREAEATILLRRNRHIDALTVIDAEIARGASARFHALRAKAYEAMGEYQPAHESAQNAIRMRNNSVEYLAHAAKMAANVDRFDVALENINRAIRIEPYMLDLYLQRAYIFRKNQKFDDARNDINFYFKYLPHEPRAMFQMGLTETDAGNHWEGIEYFTVLIDNDQTSPEYFIARARALINVNDFADAGFDLSQALDLNPELPEAWHNQGIVLHRELQLEDACHYWRRALQMGHRESAEYIYRFCL